MYTATNPLENDQNLIPGAKIPFDIKMKWVRDCQENRRHDRMMYLSIFSVGEILEKFKDYNIVLHVDVPDRRTKKGTRQDTILIPAGTKMNKYNDYQLRSFTTTGKLNDFKHTLELEDCYELHEMRVDLIIRGIPREIKWFYDEDEDKMFPFKQMEWTPKRIPCAQEGYTWAM